MTTIPLHNVPLRVVVAEDEYLSREKIKMLLRGQPNIEVVAECQQVSEAVNALRDLHPDLLLLDIQLAGGTGFDVLEKSAGTPLPTVVFVTAYDQYAIKAFELHAIDYLLKPFDEKRFSEAIDRARGERLRNDQGPLAQRLLALARFPSSGSEARVAIRTGGRIIFLECARIDWIEAAANYVCIHAGNESYLVRETMGHISERLDPTKFARIHRSLVVNVGKIKEVRPCNSGEYIVTLKTGKELSCSRNYRDAVASLVYRT